MKTLAYTLGLLAGIALFSLLLEQAVTLHFIYEAF